MRKPRIKNKYNLKPKDIIKAVVLDYNRLYRPPFWRNNVIQAWCLTGDLAKVIMMITWMYIRLDSMIKMLKNMLEKSDFIAQLMRICVVIVLKNSLTIQKLRMKLI